LQVGVRAADLTVDLVNDVGPLSRPHHGAGGADIGSERLRACGIDNIARSVQRMEGGKALRGALSVA
jgi:hypothetical protein